MQIDFVTLFPALIEGALPHSIIGRAIESEILSYSVVNPRDFTLDAHRTVDDDPYGGGPGMVLMIEPLVSAIRSLDLSGDAAIVCPDPTGTLYTQSNATELARRSRIVLVCGHYEGIDGRLGEFFPVQMVSIGDFVVTGGELPALLIADSIVRLLPGVLGSPESLEIDSHAGGLLGPPQFTRPAEFEGVRVPEVLLSGNHEAVARWRRQQALRLTRSLRPDLFARAPLSRSDLDLL